MMIDGRNVIFFLGWWWYLSWWWYLTVCVVIHLLEKLLQI
jgi:hypothetical protein